MLGPLGVEIDQPLSTRAEFERYTESDGAEKRRFSIYPPFRAARLNSPKETDSITAMPNEGNWLRIRTGEPPHRYFRISASFVEEQSGGHPRLY